MRAGRSFGGGTFLSFTSRAYAFWRVTLLGENLISLRGKQEINRAPCDSGTHRLSRRAAFWVRCYETDTSISIAGWILRS